MWRAKYQEDRIEESRGRSSEVLQKLRAMGQFELKKLPFTQGQGTINRVAPGVYQSAIARHFSVWGRYEVMPKTKKQLREEERRIPLG